MFAEGNIKGRGEKNSLFPEGPVIKSFVLPPDSKVAENVLPDVYGGCACSTSGCENKT